MDNIVRVRDFFWTDAARERVNKRGHCRKAPAPGHRNKDGRRSFRLEIPRQQDPGFVQSSPLFSTPYMETGRFKLHKISNIVRIYT